MLVVWAAHRALPKCRYGQSAPIWLRLIMARNRTHSFSRDGYWLHTKNPTDRWWRQRQFLYIHERFNDEWITVSNNLLNIKTTGISQFQSSQLNDCVYPFGVSEFIIGFLWDSCHSISSLLCTVVSTIVVFLSFFRLVIASFIHLRITASDYYWPLQIFHTAAQKLFFFKAFKTKLYLRFWINVHNTDNVINKSYSYRPTRHYHWIPRELNINWWNWHRLRNHVSEFGTNSKGKWSINDWLSMNWFNM